MGDYSRYVTGGFIELSDICCFATKLTHFPVSQINSRITNTCTHFAKYTTIFSRHLAATDTSSTIDATKLARLIDDLDKFEASFSKHLKSLLGSLNYLAATETVVFLGLCARLSNKGDGGPGSGLELYA